MNKTEITWSDHAIHRFFQRFREGWRNKVLQYMNKQDIEVNDTTFSKIALSFNKYQRKLNNIAKNSTPVNPSRIMRMQYLISDENFYKNKYLHNKNDGCVLLVRDNVIITAFRYNYRHFE